MMAPPSDRHPGQPFDEGELRQLVSFIENFDSEVTAEFDSAALNPSLTMSLYLVRSHFEGQLVTPTSLISESKLPYATANRRMQEMLRDGLIERRPRTRTGKTFSLHPSGELLDSWMRLATRTKRFARHIFSDGDPADGGSDYYFGSTASAARRVPPMRLLPQPLKVHGGISVLVHGDPTFMVMENLKRQFEQIIGTRIVQRAFSIDRLRQEAQANAARKISRYDIIALDLPWLGEFADRGVLLPLDDVLEIARADPADFHVAGWKAAHWGGRPYGIPAQTTPELLFYRRDLFAEAGLEPPATTEALLEAARVLHAPQHGRYGIAWNAARGTALGHTFLMMLADFGRPILNLPRIAGGFDTDHLHRHQYQITINTPEGLQAAEYLMALLDCSPPGILSMSWYERVRPYAAGRVAMAYGYTLLAPYFELDETCPAYGQTGYLPHPCGPGADTVAPVGGYVMGIPANLPPERREAAAEALLVFTSPEAQKLYIQNGSRTNPRYSVASDPEIRGLSPIFEAVDAMSWRDELQFWPRPPIPEIPQIIQICGEEFHDMLRGSATPREALRRAQARAEQAIDPIRHS